MEDRIRHTGIVERQSGSRLVVRILQASACSSCRAAARCHAEGTREKLVEAVAARGRKYAPGERVTVATSLTAGYRAVAVGFGLPLLLMVAVLVAVLLLTGNEIAAAAAGVTVLIPYYIGVRLLRRRIGRRVAFFVE